MKTLNQPVRSSPLRLSLIVLTFSLVRTDAQIITNNFENLTGMYLLSGTPVPGNSKLSNQLAGTSGITFASEGSVPYIAVVNLGVGHATSGTNGIGGVNNSGLLSYSTPIRITFVLPSDPTLPAVTDFVSIRNDLDPTSGQPVTLQAFGLDGVLLASTNQIDDHAFTLSITNAGIHSVLLTESDTVAYDDLVVDLPTSPPTNAPPVVVAIGPAVAINWLSDSNHVYQVEWSSLTNTNSWFGLGASVAGNGGTNTVLDAANNGSRFYRIVTLK